MHTSYPVYVACHTIVIVFLDSSRHLMLHTVLGASGAQVIADPPTALGYILIILDLS